jgi:O-acetyl-ADP-ribose deacetylase (regulator of RNase III)
MGNRLDFSFQVLQTKIQVVYRDTIRLDADVVVSTDDTYLSASSGVSRYIWDKAARAGRDRRKTTRLRHEVRKFALPLPPGAVVVTSGGYLKAKYIFHAATLDLTSRPNPERVIAEIVQNVMDLGATLGVESIVTPILVTEAIAPNGECAIVSQLSGLPETDVVIYTLRSLARYLATARWPFSVRKVTIALYYDQADDHHAAEKRISADLAVVRDEVSKWISQITPINEWMVHLLPLLTKINGQTQDDLALLQQLEMRLRSGQESLCTLIGPPTLTGYQTNDSADQDEDGPYLQEEYERLRSRLEAKLEEANNDLEHLKSLQEITVRRRNDLQEKKALNGTLTPSAVILELEDAEKELDQIEIDLEQAEEDKASCENGLKALVRGWQRRLVHPSLAVSHMAA